MHFRLYIHALVFTAVTVVAAKSPWAQEQSLSVNTTGMIGLNTVPSARMDPAGTMRGGVSTSDPYNHAFLGMQIAKPLYINLRQSMEISSVGDNPQMVYPGMDIKLRLKEEGRYAPEIAFGMNSALGHRRFSSEYFALSKRWHDWDFTLGAAWGRLGSAGHIKNPLARISSHFDKDRDYSDNNASSPSDWFTGDQIGFFGGVEYSTPLQGLSLKADFNGEAYEGETSSFDFKEPSPWSFGFNYSAKDWVSFGMSALGTDKIMARLTFQHNIFNWKKTKSYKDSDPLKFRARQSDYTSRNIARDNAEDDGINIGKTRIKDHDFSAVLHMNDYQPSTMQIGRAARHLTAKAGPIIETITIIPVNKGLRGKAVTFSRRDLEQAIARSAGSPEEIWQDVKFSDDKKSISRKTRERRITFAPELQLSIGEEETTHLYRTSLLLDERKEWRYGITTGNSFRLNLANNLHRLSKYRDFNLDSARRDVEAFAMNRVNLERSFLSFMRTPLPDFHLSATAGYLEEMYAGYGGEVLYRPFDSPFAIGAEAWNIYKRDPTTALSLGLWNGPIFTGHANIFYAVPGTDITTFAKIGRFIGGDVGVNTGAQMQFGNGVKLRGSISVTNSDDKDVFNSDRNLYAGIQLAIPLGDIKFVPEGSEARMKFAPIGRDDAAIIDKPYDLYEATEPTSYRHLAQNWQGVLD